MTILKVVPFASFALLVGASFVGEKRLRGEKGEGKFWMTRFLCVVCCHGVFGMGICVCSTESPDSEPGEPTQTDRQLQYILYCRSAKESRCIVRRKIMVAKWLFVLFVRVKAKAHHGLGVALRYLATECLVGFCAMPSFKQPNWHYYQVFSSCLLRRTQISSLAALFTIYPTLNVIDTI